MAFSRRAAAVAAAASAASSEGRVGFGSAAGNAPSSAAQPEGNSASGGSSRAAAGCATGDLSCASGQIWGVAGGGPHNDLQDQSLHRRQANDADATDSPQAERQQFGWYEVRSPVSSGIPLRRAPARDAEAYLALKNGDVIKVDTVDASSCWGRVVTESLGNTSGAATLRSLVNLPELWACFTLPDGRPILHSVAPAEAGGLDGAGASAATRDASQRATTEAHQSSEDGAAGPDAGYEDGVDRPGFTPTAPADVKTKVRQAISRSGAEDAEPELHMVANPSGKGIYVFPEPTRESEHVWGLQNGSVVELGEFDENFRFRRLSVDALRRACRVAARLPLDGERFEHLWVPLRDGKTDEVLWKPVRRETATAAPVLR